MMALESTALSSLTRDLNRSLSDKEDYELKIKTLDDEITEIHSNTPKLISNIESKLKFFSNNVYVISH